MYISKCLCIRHYKSNGFGFWPVLKKQNKKTEITCGCADSSHYAEVYGE